MPSIIEHRSKKVERFLFNVLLPSSDSAVSAYAELNQTYSGEEIHAPAFKICGWMDGFHHPNPLDHESAI